MKKTVSIAFFGNGDKYAQYISAFLRAHLNLFPLDEGWTLRIHCDDIVGNGPHGQFLHRLAERGLAEVRHMGSAILTKAMLWRMAPIFDDDVDYVFCRDLDACPMPRDRACMEAFIRSGCVVHTILDNQAHTGIMGGLCGFHAPAFRKATGFRTLDDLYAAAARTDAQWAQHGMDQVALNCLLVRLGGPRLLEHRFAGWHAGPGIFPVRGPGNYACGGLSGLTPDTGVSKFSGELAARADRLGNHLGCAGYDHAAACAFYDEHGDKAISAMIASCEADS